MYTMKEASQATGLTYETLKFYCNQGLLPNVKRDRNNHRVFDDHDVAWLKSLACLKNCGMSLAEMKAYLRLCLGGIDTIPQRKKMLAVKRKELHKKWPPCGKPWSTLIGSRPFTTTCAAEKFPTSAISHQTTRPCKRGTWPPEGRRFSHCGLRISFAPPM